MNSPALDAFASRDDLERFGSRGLLLFALQLHLGLDDIETVAASSLTDGPNDKKCDLVYFDRDTSSVIVAQGYQALNPKPAGEASAGKASDLNTAASWILGGNLDEMPDSLRSAAVEVRLALEAGQVRAFELWYVHNLKESANVQRELDRSSHTARSLISTSFPSAQVEQVLAKEVGVGTLDEWYSRTEVAIVVTDEFKVRVEGGFQESADKWSSFCTSVTGSWLQELWVKHDTDLLSPNVRDYLGIVKSEKNINFGIKATAHSSPSQFWIYNNGLTILVNDFKAPNRGRGTLTIRGLGIVNGAQTTGTLGSLDESDAKRLDDLRVMVRFVKCSDPDVLRDIVRFNNTQNKVEATDFRSNDAVQERLRKEFLTVPEADYRGGRRGGVRDAIERKKNLLPNNAVAQALAAFHGRPNLAYNDTRRIWVDDGIYAQYFSDSTTARHIVFCFSLLRAIEETKKSIQDVPEEDRTGAQRQAMGYFRRRGSLHLLLSAIAQSAETVMSIAIVDSFGLRFKDDCSPKKGAERWTPIVKACLPFATQLAGACDRDLQNTEKVTSALARFSEFVQATESANSAIYREFASRVECVPRNHIKT